MLSRIVGRTDPRWRGAIAAFLAFILLLGLLVAIDGWHTLGLLAVEHDQYYFARRSQQIFRLIGLLVVGLTTVLIYLVVSYRPQIEAFSQTQQELEQHVAKRTQELTTLLEISRKLTSTLDLQTLLDQLLEILQMIVTYDGVMVFQLENEDHLRPLVYTGPMSPDAFPTEYPLEKFPLHEKIIRQPQAIFIPDTMADTEFARRWQQSSGQIAPAVRSWIGVPLVLNQRSIGLLGLSHRQPNFYTQHQVDLTFAIASQAAIAIENTRLYKQAQLLASLEERRHLSRELHDSVSQALYGVALGARTARILLDRNPTLEQLVEPLDFVLNQAEAGLTEMRALIFELRPEILAEEGLITALAKRVDALETRHNLQVITCFGEEPDIPLSIKEALYRIAQEATHNIVKYAQAKTVELSLNSGEPFIMQIKDDGRGFDLDADFSGHMGLQSMRERVKEFGGAIDIQSKVGEGTQIQIWLSFG